jgi:hypothetical protein
MRVRELGWGVGRTHHGRLYESQCTQVDVVDHVSDVGLHDTVERGGFAPVAQERVALDDPEERTNPGLLKGRRERDRRVQARAGVPVKDVGWCPNLLAVLAPAGRRLAVADVSALHRAEDGTCDLVDPVWSGLVALQGWASGLALEDRRSLSQQALDRRVVGHHERGQHLQRELQRSG